MEIALFLAQKINFYFKSESAKFRVTHALVSYWPRTFFVRSCLTYLMPYVLSCLACFACLVPYMSCAIHACPGTWLSPPLCALIPYVPRALRFLMPRVRLVLRALVPHVPYVLLYFPCLLPWFFWCCSCYMQCGLFCSSSLTCFRCCKPNILICISCLVAFMSCGSCDFGAWAIWVFYSLG